MGDCRIIIIDMSDKYKLKSQVSKIFGVFKNTSYESQNFDTNYDVNTKVSYNNLNSDDKINVVKK